jgi:hypothetical protein
MKKPLPDPEIEYELGDRASNADLVNSPDTKIPGGDDTVQKAAEALITEDEDASDQTDNLADLDVTAGGSIVGEDVEPDGGYMGEIDGDTAPPVCGALTGEEGRPQSNTGANPGLYGGGTVGGANNTRGTAGPRIPVGELPDRDTEDEQTKK